MVFKYIHEVIPTIDFTLNALKRDTERYSLLLYQHEGTLDASVDRIGNGVDVSIPLESYFSLLKQTNADLGITPEYSCPLSVLENVIGNQGRWPNAGKLWVIGLESIPKVEMEALALQLTSASVHVCYDTDVIALDNNFLDPVVYMFLAEINGQSKLTVVFQFKTQHMGARGAGAIERDNMVKGRDIYILRNDADSVHLLTLICSEAMVFSNSMTTAEKQRLHWANTPFLILNPQANPVPDYTEFVNFRTFVQSSERKEVISLNWNKRSRFGAGPLMIGGSSRSGFFIQSSDIEYTNLVRLRANHRLGMYYFYFARDRHAFLLNSAAHAFFVKNLSVNITTDPPALRNRNGPELIASYILNDVNQLSSVLDTCDEHLSYLASLACGTACLVDPDMCVIEKEILACLCSADIDSRSLQGWSLVDKLPSLRFSESDEVNKRLTVAEDNHQSSVDARAKYVERIETLTNQILPDQTLLPITLSNLKDKQLVVGFSGLMDGVKRKIEKELFRFNITTPDSDYLVATVAYLGLANEGQAKRKFTSLQNLFEQGNPNRNRIVVYYKNGNRFRFISAEASGTINSADLHNANSYLK